MRLCVVAAFSLVTLCSSPILAADQVPSDQELIVRYVNARQNQQQALRGVHMEVEINGSLPKMEKKGKLNALRTVTRLGQIIYKQTGFSGDDQVKKELIARYLSAEVEERDRASIAISPTNYKFKLKGITLVRGQATAIFELNPRQKRVGLFKGELWIDAESGMPLKESGRWVKSPSVFLKNIDFVQDYELKDGISIPKHISSKMEVRLVGRAELDVSFSNISKDETKETALAIQAE